MRISFQTELKIGEGCGGAGQVVVGLWSRVDIR